MTNQVLNCPACGSPVPVPENREFINCPYCAAILAIIRGDGYTAFKMVETITKTLPTLDELSRKTGQLPPLSEPQSSPSEETPQGETVQISEQIQLAEMQLANLQAEIEALERAQQVNRNTKPLRRLYTQKFQVLEGLRTLNLTLAAQGPQDYDNRINGLKAEVDWLNAEIQALESALEGGGPENSSAWENTIDKMRDYRRKLVIKIGDLQVEKIKSQLASFQVKEVKLHDNAAIDAIITTIRADQDKIARMAQTLEVSIVKDELAARYQALLKAQAALKKASEPTPVKPLMIPVSSADNEDSAKPASGGLFGMFKRRK